MRCCLVVHWDDSLTEFIHRFNDNPCDYLKFFISFNDCLIVCVLVDLRGGLNVWFGPVGCAIKHIVFLVFVCLKDRSAESHTSLARVMCWRDVIRWQVRWFRSIHQGKSKLQIYFKARRLHSYPWHRSQFLRICCPRVYPQFPESEPHTGGSHGWMGYKKNVKCQSTKSRIKATLLEFSNLDRVPVQLTVTHSSTAYKIRE